MNFTKVCFALLFAMTMAGVPAVHASCTNASVKGTYGILSTGLNGSLQPASSLDQVTLDGLGHLSGTATKSIDGSLVNFPFTGSYNIAQNCIGTTTFTNQSAQSEHDNIYVNNASTGAFLIQTDSSHVQSSIAVAQGPATCTNLGVQNSYTFEATGTVIGTGQVASAGKLTLAVVSGVGSITGKETLSLDGVIHSNVSVTGTYKINANCTGTAKITPSGLTAMNLALVVVNGGKQIMAIETDKNTIVAGTFQQ